MDPLNIPEIAGLSIPEKILLVEDLWDSIARDETQIPVPESHRAELDRRAERLRHSSIVNRHSTFLSPIASITPAAIKGTRIS